MMSHLHSVAHRTAVIGLCTTAAVLLLAAPLQAGTVGYWRFEGANWLDDSSGNGLTLGISSATPAPNQATLPATGPGSAFDNPVPQTGDTNLNAARYTTTSGDTTSGGNFYVLDSSLPVVHDFTAEAYVNKQLDTSRTQYVVSHFRTDSNRRSWALGVAGSSDIGGISGSAYDLFLLLSDDGTDSNVVASGVNIDIGDDYYVAASFDESQQSGGVTFFVQNLTDGGPLQMVSVDHSIVSLYDSTAALRIGTYSAADSGWSGGGLIDEVRYSSDVVPVGQLLISSAVVPEPGALLLLVSGALVLLLRWRSR